MAKQTRMTKDKQQQEKRRRNGRSAPKETAGVQTGVVTPVERPGKPSDAGRDVTVQAARLTDERLQGAQRRAFATEIGQTQGNQHFQRAVASLKTSKGVALALSGGSSTVIQRNPDPLSPAAERLKAQILEIIHQARTAERTRRGLTPEERRRIMDLLGTAADGALAELNNDEEFTAEIRRRLHRAVYGPMLRALELATRRERLPQVSFRHDVPLIPQISDVSCWSAAAAMLVAWRMGLPRDQALSVREIAQGAGLRHLLHRPTGLLESGDLSALASAWGLTVEPARSYTVQALYDMLTQHGPLWLVEASGGTTLHAIVISGMIGDGSPEGTQLQIHDPWPRRRGQVRFETFQWLMGLREAVAGHAAEVALSILHP